MFLFQNEIIIDFIKRNTNKLEVEWGKKMSKFYVVGDFIEICIVSEYFRVVFLELKREI